MSAPVWHAGLQTRTGLLIVLTVFFNATGNLFLSVGMKKIGEVPSWSLDRLAKAGVLTMTNGIMWLGIIMLALFFISYLLLLSWADYSYVLPASAAGYAIVPLLGYAFAGEHVTSLRWSGVLLICVGIFTVGRTPVRTAGLG